VGAYHRELDGVDQDPGAGFDQGVAVDAEVRELAVVGAHALQHRGQRGGGCVGVEAALVHSALAPEALGQGVEQRPQRLAPVLAERARALVGCVVAHAQHRVVRVPEVEEGRHQHPRIGESRCAFERAGEKLQDLRQPRSRLGRQLERRGFDAREVLVEARRRGARAPRDLDHHGAAHPALAEQLGGGVEQPPPRAEPARAELSPRRRSGHAYQDSL